MLHAIDQKDILITGFTMCRLENREKIGSIAGDPSTENMARAMKEGLLNSCWGKLYRREVIWGLRFSEEIFWGEDTAYLMSCLCRTDKVIFCPFHDYLYTFSTSGLANRFVKQKPYYLGAYYKQLTCFWSNGRKMPTLYTMRWLLRSHRKFSEPSIHSWTRSYLRRKKRNISVYYSPIRR